MVKEKLLYQKIMYATSGVGRGCTGTPVFFRIFFLMFLNEGIEEFKIRFFVQKFKEKPLRTIIFVSFLNFCLICNDKMENWSYIFVSFLNSLPYLYRQIKIIAIIFCLFCTFVLFVMTKWKNWVIFLSFLNSLFYQFYIGTIVELVRTFSS